MHSCMQWCITFLRIPTTRTTKYPSSNSFFRHYVVVVSFHWNSENFSLLFLPTEENFHFYLNIIFSILVFGGSAFVFSTTEKKIAQSIFLVECICGPHDPSASRTKKQLLIHSNNLIHTRSHKFSFECVRAASTRMEIRSFDSWFIK